MKSAIALSLLFAASSLAAYSPIREYSGQTFFDHWTFFDQTDAQINNGDVQFLGESAAQSQQLAFINGAGNAIIKVDNTTTVNIDDKRDSIRLESLEAYGVGSLIVIDVVHLPFGCSVWPAFWTRGIGAPWPTVGEIDIIEGVNQRDFNQMALHTTQGCAQPNNVVQSGTTLLSDCTTDPQHTSGCTVRESKPASYGTAFNAAGGGVFAAQFDVSGIFIWFFGRANVPAGISSNATSLDPTSWGTPSAAWPSSSCSIADHFSAQQLVLDITLCGDFATPTYNQTCPPPRMSCYQDNVVGNGSNYRDAYFEIPFIRVYGADPSVAPVAFSTGSVITSTATGVSPSQPMQTTTTPVSGGGGSGNGTTNEAHHDAPLWNIIVFLTLSSLYLGLMY